MRRSGKIHGQTPMSKRRIHTAETDRILRDGWAAGVPNDTVLMRFNAAMTAAGLPAVSIHTMLRRVRDLKLYRPAWFVSERSKRARASQIQQAKDRAKTGVKKQCSGIRVRNDHGGYWQKPPNEIVMSTTTVECDRETVLDWSRQWCRGAQDLRAINAERMRWGLPAFVVPRHGLFATNR